MIKCVKCVASYVHNNPLKEVFDFAGANAIFRLVRSVAFSVLLACKLWNIPYVKTKRCTNDQSYVEGSFGCLYNVHTYNQACRSDKHAMRAIKLEYVEVTDRSRSAFRRDVAPRA